MFVGGEFYTDRRWVTDASTLSTGEMYFLAGGKACLMVIGDYLRDHGIDRILLPSYLCPSILTALERGGLKYDYYQVNADLSIDLDDLAQKAVGYRAVYFINYFGFLPAPAARDRFKTLQAKGVIVVEDNAQAGFAAQLTGDFIFNSLRKLAGYDGGYLITRQAMAPYIEAYAACPNRRLPVIREYRSRLYRYLYRGKGSYEYLEALFNQAEQFYETDLVVLGDPQERAQIERLDWPGIKQVRRDNYEYLLGRIATIPEISPIFPALQADNMPLGLPVYFTGVSRDQVYEALGNAGIGLTIHWEDILSDPRTNGSHLAVDMASRMLTLIIDQRTSRQQLDYLVENLIKSIAAARRLSSLENDRSGGGASGHPASS